MKYTVSKSIVRIVGGIWLPYGATYALDKDLSDYDVRNLRDEEGKITRESIEQWIACNSGDFSSIIGWSASIEDNGETLDFPWPSEEIECQYFDCFAESK